MRIKFPKGKKPKFFLISLLLVALSLGAVFVFSGKDNSTASQEKNRLFFPQEVNFVNNNIDTDGDGLMDWEEEIYATDPENADTDSDGTNDEDEIAQNRDPLKPSPDEIVAEEVGPTSVPETENDDNNLTRKVSETFIKSYFSQRYSGREFNPAELSQIVMNTVENEPLFFRSVSPDGLKIIKTKEPEKIKTYLNAVASIAENTLTNWTVDPIQLLASVLQQENFEKQLHRFDIFVERTEKAKSGLLALEVPESWTKEHLTLVNNVLTLNIALKAMRASDRDIVFMLTTLQPFELAREILRNLLTHVQKRIAAENIKFSGEEPMGKIVTLRLQ